MKTTSRFRAQAVLDETATSEHARCMLCGQENPSGFKLKFQALDEGEVEACDFSQT